MSKAAWFRVLTAEGRGAIAVVVAWGPDALDVIDAVFRPAQGPPLSRTARGRLRLGRAGIGLGDEVVAVRINASPPIVELQCHGGAAAVAAVVRDLLDAGAARADAEAAPPSEVDDRIRAQAMDDLASAPTLRVAEILLDQGHGTLRRALERLAEEPDTAAPKVLADVNALIRVGEVGVRLLRGWKVVIAGRPNVGKSRLFNAMAGFDRSIVNPQPGVTRDVVTLYTAYDGWPVELSDTAGERATADFIEALGISKSLEERSEADVVILVLDRSQPLQDVDLALLHSTAGALIVANKGDLPPAWESAPRVQSDSGPHTISAETGEGLEDLIRALTSRLVPHPPASGAAVPFRPQHLQSLREARDCLLAGDRGGFVLHIRQITGSRTST
jgi:tRNA modification GTPase